MLIAVIMAGGTGKRFWPLSRQENPKQFLKISSDLSMIQVTAKRLEKAVKAENIFVVTAASQAHLVQEHLPCLPKENIIVEPEGMNTAPAIALSAYYIARKYKSTDKMFVLPADQEIIDVDNFLETLIPAEKAAEDNNLVTFGITPHYPATGYGYIEAGKAIDNGHEILNFKEKPDLETAEFFINSGNYYWNSGMFMWELGVIKRAYEEYLPKIVKLFKNIEIKWDKEGLSADISELYAKMPRIPVDIGILEQADRRVVIPVDYDWSDVGGWKALYDMSAKDEFGNVLKCEAEILDSSSCYVHSNKLVSLIGVNNLIVVDTDDVLLIADTTSSERVKEIVTVLEANKKHHYL